MSCRDAGCTGGPETCAVCAEWVKLESENVRLREAKDGAYRERNQLVAFLSKLYPSHRARHPASDETWENDWRWIICIHSPFGQLSWHIHDSDLPMFEHLETNLNDWDGHSTEEKYRRLEQALRGEESK